MLCPPLWWILDILTCFLSQAFPNLRVLSTEFCPHLQKLDSQVIPAKIVLRVNGVLDVWGRCKPPVFRTEFNRVWGPGKIWIKECVDGVISLCQSQAKPQRRLVCPYSQSFSQNESTRDSWYASDQWQSFRVKPKGHLESCWVIS